MIVEIDYDEFKSKWGVVERKENYHPREVSYDIIASLVNHYKPKNILEIGTQYGGGTIILAMYSDGLVHTIDIPKEHYPDLVNKIAQPNDRMKLSDIGIVFGGHPEEAKRIIQLYGDSKTFEVSILPKMDFVFIDGDHTRDSVIADTEQALKLLRSGGVLFWHDIQIPEVAEAIQHYNYMDILTVANSNATFTVIP
jgi:predicted O-methyltransferase YrrM